jgi:hypothetical protein
MVITTSQGGRKDMGHWIILYYKCTNQRLCVVFKSKILQTYPHLTVTIELKQKGIGNNLPGMSDFQGSEVRNMTLPPSNVWKMRRPTPTISCLLSVTLTITQLKHRESEREKRNSPLIFAAHTSFVITRTRNTKEDARCKTGYLTYFPSLRGKM